MSAPSILGRTTAGVRVQRRRRWSRQGGLEFHERWSGPIAVVEGIFNKNASPTTGVSEADFVSVGGRGVCDIVWANEPSTLTTVWEVLPNEMEVPIEQHSTFAAADKTAMALARKEYIAGKALSSSDATIIKYYTFLSKGIDAYIDSGLSLCKTNTVSSQSTLAASYTGVNQVQAISEIGPPSKILGALPAGWEWLKKMPTVRELSKGRYQIRQEWWGAEHGWSTILYGGTLTP